MAEMYIQPSRYVSSRKKHPHMHRNVLIEDESRLTDRETVHKHLYTYISYSCGFKR